MPITEKDLSYEDMKKAISRGACCGQCGEFLSIAWGGSLGYDCNVLRCSDLSHNTIRAIEGKSHDRLESEKLFRRIHILKGTELEKMTQTQMLERVGMARFPQELNKTQAIMIAKIAVEYGLDPLMGELMIYQGSLYVPLAARLRKAQETEKLDGINTRPATEEEKKGRKYGDDDYVMVAEIWKVGSSRPFQGWGIVRGREIMKAEAQAKAHNRDPYALPVVKDPAQHAEKRAIARGLKMGFHLPLPSAEDIGGEEDAAPGIIIEGEAKEVKMDPVETKAEIRAPTIENGAPQKEKPTDNTHEPELAPPPGEESEPMPDPEPEPPTSSKNGEPQNIKDLLEWVSIHGKTYNRSWVLRAISLTEEELPNRISDAYHELLQLTGWDPR